MLETWARKGEICISWEASCAEKTASLQWTTVYSWQAHTKNVTALCAHGEYVATGSSDATVIVWKRVTSSEESKGEE